MISCRTLLTDAFQYSGIYAPSEVPTADEINQALRLYNQVIESWNVEGLLTYTDDLLEQDLSGVSHETLTIGPTGEVTTSVRPASIKDMYYRIGNIDYFMTEIDARTYDAIGLKNIGSGFPQFYFYQPDFPNGLLKFWPKIDQAGTLFVRINKYLRSISSLDDGISFPPGYETALTWFMAYTLATTYQVADDVVAKIQSQADRFVDIVKRNNIKIGTLNADPLSASGNNSSASSTAMNQFVYGQMGMW